MQFLYSAQLCCYKCRNRIVFEWDCNRPIATINSGVVWQLHLCRVSLASSVNPLTSPDNFRPLSKGLDTKNNVLSGQTIGANTRTSDRRRDRAVWVR